MTLDKDNVPENSETIPLSIDAHLHALESSAKGLLVPLERALKELTDPDDIIAFHMGLVNACKMQIQNDISAGNQTEPASSVNAGEKTLDEAALSLAGGHLAYVIRKTLAPNEQKKWTDAIPGLQIDFAQ